MATVSLSAKARDTIGTGNARKLRQAGEVPGVIYGHSREAQSLTLNSRELEKLLTQIAGTSTVVELTMDGKTARTLIREAETRADQILQKAQARLIEVERDINEMKLRRRDVEGSLESAIASLTYALDFMRGQDQAERDEKLLLHRPKAMDILAAAGPQGAVASGPQAVVTGPQPVPVPGPAPGR